MEFRIAATFTSSLSKLTNEEQKAVKTTAFDLQINPANPAMQFHRLDAARDKNFWSVRVTRDIRLIVHRTADSLLLCYVDHHDEAYRWAERRKLETHPTTGAAQLVEIRERVEEVVIPTYVMAQTEEAPQEPLLDHLPESELLAYGVPPDWIEEVKRATEESLLDLVDHLPQEAAEALLELATGGRPQPAPKEVPAEDPFDHPDAQRRFRTIKDAEELERALEFPWEKWTVFLHPAQRQTVERDYNGPARVTGSAGTGKTIVALHRAVHLARSHPETRVLLTTFSPSLARSLALKLRRLIGNEPRIADRLEVHSIEEVGRRLLRLNFGQPTIASHSQIRELIAEALAEIGGVPFSLSFVMAEWKDVVDAWHLTSWEAYRDITRLGRKTRLALPHREKLWSVFHRLRQILNEKGLTTESEVFHRLADHYATEPNLPYDFIVVDEAQDLSVAQLRFLASVGRSHTDSLFFAGDLGQRIFQQPFSWLALGVDIRGRSSILRVNYRTSHQIRSRADLLLGSTVSDVDGEIIDRRGTTSVFNGPEPDIEVLADEETEAAHVADWIKARLSEGVELHEIAVFVRSANELDRARAAILVTGLSAVVLDDHVESEPGSVSIATMHHAKGLEFRAVAVMACDDDVIPQQERLELIGDEADLEEVYNTERHLLYVACTRARDYLLVTGVDPASEFLEDLVQIPAGPRSR